ARAAKAVAERLRPRAGDYALAAWDFARSPGDLAAFARDRGLEPTFVRAWIDRLGLADDVALPRSVKNVNGRAGVHLWRGAADCPNAIVNTTDEPVSMLSFRLPPRSVAIHPGPTGGVSLAWRSPVAGTVRVRGRVADADPVAGDGIAW